MSNAECMNSSCCAVVATLRGLLKLEIVRFGSVTRSVGLAFGKAIFSHVSRYEQCRLGIFILSLPHFGIHVHSTMMILSGFVPVLVSGVSPTSQPAGPPLAARASARFA